MSEEKLNLSFIPVVHTVELTMDIVLNLSDRQFTVFNEYIQALQMYLLPFVKDEILEYLDFEISQQVKPDEPV